MIGVLIALLNLAPFGPQEGPALIAPAERGVALGLFSSDPTYDYGMLVSEVAALGATHLEISYVWWQDDLRAGTIKVMPGWSPTDPQIVRTVEQARALGLHVTIFPILRLIRADKGEWRGKIAPADLDQWWSSYQSFILHAADLAAKTGAERIAVGSELVSREHERERWLELIERVRLAAPNAEILYSANWDHFEPITFWDAVDVVGLTGYWELTQNYDASIEELAAAWPAVLRKLDGFSRTLGRPILITEIGYPSLEGGAVWPWDQTRKAAVDLEEQRRAYEAFAQSFSGARFLGGVYFWNWFGFGGSGDSDYTPRNKPAAEVVRRWYGARP